MTRSRTALRFGETLALDLVVGEAAPPAAEAVVVPQDVNMIMGDVEAVVEASEPTEDLAARLSDFQPQRAGTLVVGPSRKARPLLLQAVVYDFDRSPPAWEEPVFEALLTAFEEAKARGFSSIAVRPLGTAHSGLPPAVFLKVLAQICYSAAELGTTLRRVWLLLPSPAELQRYQGLLEILMRERARERRAAPPDR